MKKIYSLLTLAVLSTLVCAGCVEKTPIYYGTAFNKAQAERQMRPGRNTVIVNCFTKAYMDDSISTCAGVPTLLMPATERAAEFTQIIFGSAAGGKRKNSKLRQTTKRMVDDPDFDTLYMSQKCDSDGFSVFKKVSDGEFYVFSGAGGYSYAEKISVRGGETKKVVLSGTASGQRGGFDYELWERNERRREWEARQRKK